MHNRPIFNELKKRVQEPRKFIQTLLGPRQVGKTTLALQLEKSLNIPTRFISADTFYLTLPNHMHGLITRDRCFCGFKGL